MSRRMSNKTTPCPECMMTVTLKKKPQLGHVVQCKHCHTRLEVVEIFPLELDLAYDDDEEIPAYDDDYEYDEYEVEDYGN